MSSTRSNLVVLRGTVVGQPTHRDLPSGGTVTQFDLRTQVDDSDRTSNVTVPVSWPDPPRDLPAGANDIVVIGTVRRRFFRVGGATQSRTEVVAEQVLAATRRANVRTAIATAVDSLETANH